MRIVYSINALILDLKPIILIPPVRNKVVLRHILVWFTLTIYLLMFDPVIGTLISNLIGTPSIILNYALVYYFLCLVIFPWLWKRNKVWLITACVFTYAAFVLIDYFIFEVLITSLGGQNPYTFGDLAKVDTVYFMIIVVSASTYYLNEQAIQKLQELFAKERILLGKELDFLKNQFNSHITMNFLTFCYSNVLPTLPDTADAIESFAKILRYTLQTKPDEKILLADEVEYIKNYIDLQRLLTSEVYVDFEVKGVLNGQKVLPRILITMVENAFKHGQYNNPEKPIVIILHATHDEISLSVRNRKNNRKVGQISGIGHNNMKQILDLFYKDHYKFESKYVGEEYSCFLSLSL